MDTAGVAPGFTLKMTADGFDTPVLFEESSCEGGGNVASESMPLRDLFYEDDYLGTLTQKVLDWIDQRSPVFFDEVAKSIAANHGMRAGSRIRDRIRSALGNQRTCVKAEDGRLICWAKDQQPVAVLKFRDEIAYGQRRLWESIPDPERASLIKSVLTQGVKEEDVASRVMQIIGYKRQSPSTLKEITEAIPRVVQLPDA